MSCRKQTSLVGFKKTQMCGGYWVSPGIYCHKWVRCEKKAVNETEELRMHGAGPELIGMSCATNSAHRIAEITGQPVSCLRSDEEP